MSLTTGTIVYDQWLALGHTIKNGRIAHRWTLRTFARMAGISFGYLGFIESARCPPPSDTVLLKMVELLEIPQQTLFAQAGRLPPEVLSQFWQHPAVAPVLSTIPGMDLSAAQVFCAQVGRILPTSLV